MEFPDGKEKHSRFLSRRILCLYAACFLVPIGLTLIAFACAGVYPFGSTSPLIEDQYYQYLDLYQWMTRVLSGDANLLYSFGKSLGGNMLPTYAYYLASPTSLLLPLFGADHLLDYVVFIRCLHTGLAGLTLAVFTRHRFDLGAVPTFALAMGYALCQYQLVQACNAMWLDAVWLLPLVALGIYRVVRKDRTILLFVTLLITIFSSWYTGYMVVLASILLFVIELMLFSFDCHGKLFNLETWKRPVGIFVLTMVLVALAACVCLIPALEGLLVGKTAGVEAVPYTQLVGIILIHPWQLLCSGFFPASYQVNWTGPQFFCGTATALLIFGVAVSSHIPGKVKALFGIVLAGLLCCAIVAYLDSAWTGFSHGLNYYCRWSFVIEFILVFIAGYGIPALREDTIPRKLIAALLFAVFAVVALILGAFQPDAKSGAGFTLVYFNGYLIIACGLVVCAFTWARSIAVRIVFCLLVCLDMGVNAYTVVHADTSWAKTTPDVQTLSNYRQAKTSSLGVLFTEKNSMDIDSQEVYRTEFLSGLNSSVQPQSVFPTSESLAFGYMPFTQYVSTNDSAPAKFFMDMGYSTRSDICSKNDEFHTTYADSQLAADALLGLKYIEAQQRPAGYVDTGLAALPETKWYENPDALSLGYAVEDSALETIKDTGNPFEYQNALFSSLCGRDVAIYVPIDSIKANVEADAVDWVVSGYSMDDLVYGYVTSETLYRSNAVLYAGEKRYIYFTRFDNGIRNIPLSDNTTQVRLEAVGSGSDNTLKFSAYRLDREALDSALNQLRQGSVKFEAFEDGYVKARCSNSKDSLVMFSIPFDDGWDVTVNGKKATPEKVDNIFLAIQTEAGESVIEMHYVSPGLLPGAAISLMGITTFIVWTLWRRRPCRR